jgi:hypothetical protein
MSLIMHGWKKTLLPLAAAAIALCALAAPAQTATTTPAPAADQTAAPAPPGKFSHTAPVTYDNRYEIFGGISFLSYQAGQNLPHLMSMGGAEIQGTYWLNDRWGVVLSGRAGAGTTPVLSPYYNRVAVYQETGLAGVNMRWKHTQYAALGVQAMAGASHGVFDYAVQHYPGGSPVGACSGPNNLGLFCNSTKGQAVAGLSLDINHGPRWAIRLAPEVVFDHRSSELREFFYLAGGVVYRFGHR